MAYLNGSQEFLNIQGVDSTIVALKNFVDTQKATLAETLRDLTRTILIDLAEHTPQYTGNLASNWQLEVGAVHQGYGTYTQLPNYVESKDWQWTPNPPHAAGDPQAKRIVLDNAIDALSRIRYNSKITIVNKTPYAIPVAEGLGPPKAYKVGYNQIRDVNKFEGQPFVPWHGVAMAEYAKAKYGSLRYRDYITKGRR